MLTGSILVFCLSVSDEPDLSGEASVAVVAED